MLVCTRNCVVWSVVIRWTLPSSELTASFGVFDEDLDLQHAPRNVRIVAHQCQTDFELLVDPELDTTVFDLASDCVLHFYSGEDDVLTHPKIPHLLRQHVARHQPMLDDLIESQQCFPPFRSDERFNWHNAIPVNVTENKSLKTLP